MNNDRGQSLQIPQKTTLRAGHIYVATLCSVSVTDFLGEIKHQFTYEIEVDNQILYANRNILVQTSGMQLSINDWLKQHSNYSVNHETYAPYIDCKHLVLIGQYNGNCFVQDVAPLNRFGGVLS
ncbi:hypothetical protein ABFP08_00915 [Mammaliicoccus sciuri]